MSDADCALSSRAISPTPQFNRLGIGTAPDSNWLITASSTRGAINNVIDRNVSFNWTPASWPSNVTVTCANAYLLNNTSTSSAITHGVAMFGQAEDTAAGQLLIIGMEGNTLGYGAGTYYGGVGHVSYRNATTNSAQVIAGLYALIDITTDGNTSHPLNQGTAIGVYAPAIVGGGAASKYSFYGVDPLKCLSAVYSFDAGNTKSAYMLHDGSNATFAASSGAVLITTGVGSGILLVNGVFFAPLTANTCSIGANTFEISDIWMAGKMAKYSYITTVGWGIPAIYGTGRSTAQTAAVATVATYTVGAADGSFIISANVNVTTATTHSFTVTVAYTDETNAPRTLTLAFSNLAGTVLTAITNVTGVGPYEGLPVRIRCKTATSITVATTGTFTSVAYNVEADIMQVN